MSVYQHSIDVDAPAELVFEFVSDVKNLPQIIPWVREATSADSDRVVLHGKGIRAEAHLHLDPDERMMHWDSEPSGSYHGELSVTREESRSKVNACLIVEHGSHVDQGMRDALQQIKNACERMPKPAERDLGYLG
jgi:uncharacterized membrane protein